MAANVTMADLARLSGVDVSTVSRALNDSPRVRSETKREILRLAEELGYEVNAAARTLRKRSTETIGIVVPIDPSGGQTISDPFYLEMIGAVSHAAGERGYDLLLTLPHSDGRIAERRLLRTGKVDGLIVIGQAGRQERLNALAETTDRLVVWGGALEDARYTVVGADNRAGGHEMGRHLYGRGRRRVLFVGDPGLPEVALRLEGLRAAAAEAGAPAPAILRAGFGGKTLARDFGAILDGGDPPDAVFAASDVLALRAMALLAERRVAVPGTVAVAGFDDIAAASQAMPGLTTIRQNIAQGGRMMVELMLRKLQGETVDSRVTETELVIRGSTM